MQRCTRQNVGSNGMERSDRSTDANRREARGEEEVVGGTNDSTTAASECAVLVWTCTQATPKKNITGHETEGDMD